MMDFLRDSIWQFIGAFLGLIAIAISVRIYYLQRGRKEITYEVLSNSPIVNVKNEIKSEIKIFYKNRPVEGINLIIIRFYNSGTLSISTHDFEEPIKLFLGDSAELINSEIIETKPEQLNPKLNNEKDNITIAPLLLNPGDSFSLKIISLKPNEELKISGRILGIKEISNAQIKSISVKFSNIFAITLLTSAFMYIGFTYSYYGYDFNMVVIYVCLLIINFVVIFVATTIINYLSKANNSKRS